MSSNLIVLGYSDWLIKKREVSSSHTLLAELITPGAEEKCPRFWITTSSTQLEPSGNRNMPMERTSVLKLLRVKSFRA